MARLTRPRGDQFTVVFLIIGAFVAGITVGPPFVSAATKVAQVFITNTAAEPVPVAGTVTVGNLPATQPVSGVVAIANFPATQPVVGSVTVANLPATQPVSGTVGISGTPNVNVSGTVGISGTPNVNVSNFPATQRISGTVGVAEETVSLASAKGTIAPRGGASVLPGHLLDVSAYKSVVVYFTTFSGGERNGRCRTATHDPDANADHSLGEFAFTHEDDNSAYVIDPAPLNLWVSCVNLDPNHEITYSVLVTGRTN